jgi:hypothetical protein
MPRKRSDPSPEARPHPSTFRQDREIRTTSELVAALGGRDVLAEVLGITKSAIGLMAYRENWSPKHWDKTIAYAQVKGRTDVTPLKLYELYMRRKVSRAPVYRRKDKVDIPETGAVNAENSGHNR